MNDAYICDRIRTPFGRYAGALAGIRADYLAAVPIKALIGPPCSSGLGGGRRCDLRLRQSGRRRQSQCGTYGRVAGGFASRGTRNHA